MSIQKTLFYLTIVVMNIACNEQGGQTTPVTDSARAGTFGYDVEFLRKHDSGLVQLSDNYSSILISPKYQAKVFTSTASGDTGKSFGWINYKVFGAPADPHMNAYGGENRFWLGPEGGKYSLYFNKGDSMVFANWKTPPPIDTETWDVLTKNDRSVTLAKNMSVKNFAGTTLDIGVERSIAMQDKNAAEKELNITINDSVKFVGYTTNNIIKNSGKEEWTEKTGMPCIWILDMFNPSDSTTIVIPYKPGQDNEKVATTDYFGEIGNDRIRLSGKTLFFKADGKKRGKLGIVPKHALPVAGSYDAENNVLTITSFTVDNDAKYLNQEWNTSKPVFSGDAMNAYNDGPLDDGSQMGPFYEIESVSPAAALKPGATLTHRHSVYHFTGDKSSLDEIASKILGVTLSDIQQAFK